MRIGFGYDAHRLTPGRRLVLGGVEIPHSTGLLGHSDADVICHALIDAILGAAAQGDIGGMFPDSDPAYSGADSLKLLSAAAEHIRSMGFPIHNADVSVVAQEPKLAPYIPEMRKRLASSLGIDVSFISVKATTEERMGFTGSCEGISAYAVALLDETV